jgi:hypothetical protein
VPKKLQLYGRTIDMDKVVEEVGDRKAELARMLTKWRDTIDENNENDKYVDLTSSFSPEYDKLVKLFPEISTENETLLTQGVVMEKGQPNPIPNFPYDPEKYAKLKESQLIPFLLYMQELLGNAGMHDSHDPKSDFDKETIQHARDTFDMYARFFAGKN